MEIGNKLKFTGTKATVKWDNTFMVLRSSKANVIWDFLHFLCSLSVFIVFVYLKTIEKSLRIKKKSASTTNYCRLNQSEFRNI